MQILAESLDREAAYKIVTGAVVPRPIAWVTTLNPGGGVNLAPFSAFTFVSSFPPMLGFNVGLRDGKPKDTRANIHAIGEYVVNLGDETMVEAIHNSSIDYPPDVSETEALGLATAPSVRVKPPRLAAAPISMECRFQQGLTFGKTGGEFMIGEVLLFHVRDDLISNGKIDTAKMRPVCRIGGPNYAGLGPIVTLAPVGNPWESSAKRRPAG
jgi:flavin reductase (DIM6/NTAB) family NADH-FMN oxidoreductase RutF